MDACPERYALSVKALRLCQLSRGESQRISLIQQVLTVGYNWLPLWGSWRGAPERAHSADADRGLQLPPLLGEVASSEAMMTERFDLQMPYS